MWWMPPASANPIASPGCSWSRGTGVPAATWAAEFRGRVIRPPEAW